MASQPAELSSSHTSPITPIEVPTSSLVAAQIERFRSIVEGSDLGGESVRYSYVARREPLRSGVSGDEMASVEVGALLTDLSDDTLREVVVDLDAGEVTKVRQLDPALDGWGPSLDEYFAEADAIVKTDETWVAALAKRGITDLDRVRTVPLSAGVFNYPDEVGLRTFRVLAFWQEYPTDSVWAHPIDGVVAHVDLSNARVLRVVETDITHVPTESGDYLDPAVRGPLRTSLKPIEIRQPEGASFSLDGDLLQWERWSLRVGFNGREGLTLHQMGFEDQGRIRPIINRASVSEMVVNYGDPTPTHAWQNYFDVGEYQFGRLANSLELGCDCLGEITYMDAIVADDLGNPRTIKNAICIHEEDYGILWKHTDDFSGTSETRRQRRLVISFFVTVGNYDYGFYWYLYLDGTIELEAKATGIVFTSGHPGGDYPFATELAPGLGAPVHQHMFSARLDMAVDGFDNAIDEIDVARVESGEGNPWGNAFTRTITRLSSEKAAVRDACGSLGRTWRISSASARNRVGEPTSYVLLPTDCPTLLSSNESSARARAGFATHHLWVTRYDREELWAAGRTVNQHPGAAGLPSYVEQDRSIDGEDLVVWHTFGLTHFPRLEDWPIMPVDYAGFTLKPHGFFDRNPTLDVPASSSHSACGCAGGASCTCSH